MTAKSSGTLAELTMPTTATPLVNRNTKGESKTMNALKLRSFFPSALLILTLVAPAVRGQGVADSLLLGARTIELAAKLSGFQQVPPVLSNGKGSFSAEIHDINSITFRLNYSGLSSPVTGAHVHFGQKGANGGIIFFLCGCA